MKIAVVAPGSVPYTIGGAEKLWWGLVDHINSLTSYDAELVKLSSPERTFPELMASYRRFSELDLSRFDRIISTKYPAWMVDHPDHVVYMQHKLRGLYDAYHFCGKPKQLDPDSLKTAPAPLQALMDFSQHSDPDREMLPEFWSKLEAALAVAPEWFVFPGPITRRLVHFLDGIGLRRSAITKYCAISENVAGREHYFPLGVAPEVIHHPSDLPEFKNTGADYIYTVSRLDGPKRIDLLLDAFMKTKDDVEFRIAGEGPQEQELKRRAAGDPRVRFLGRVSDAETIAQYAGAIFIPFIPYDEDYGLITYEAMRSEKAVLTTFDSGGPNELVEHGVNGLVVNADPDALAEAMRELLADRDRTAAWGRQAARAVRHISWSNTVSALLSQVDPVTPQAAAPGEAGGAGCKAGGKSHGGGPGPGRRRQRWLVTTTFPVWPPRSGGQSRIFNLYKEVARFRDVTLLSYTEPDDPFARRLIAPGLVEIRVPRSPEHHHYDVTHNQTLGVSVGDICAMEYFRATPHYLQLLKQLGTEADIVIASHPYTYPALRHVYRGPFWYEAHNVEYDMKAAILPPCEEGRHWLERVRDTESACYLDASRLLLCSSEDLDRFRVLYGVKHGAEVDIVPNGVTIHSDYKALVARKPHLRRRLGLGDQYTALFMGSWHGPNIEAAQWIIANAPALPSVRFLLVGSVCGHPVCERLPPNVLALGVLEEDQKNLLVQAVDIAINPIDAGSGTNLKMFDYAAAGTLTLTTPFGNRGLPFVDKRSTLIANLEDFLSVLRRQSHLKTTNDGPALTMRAYQLAERYDWTTLGAGFLENLQIK